MNTSLLPFPRLFASLVALGLFCAVPTAQAAKCPKDTKPLKVKHADGGLKSSGCVLVDGNKHGPWEQWNPAGVLVAQGQYENNERVGLWLSFYDSGSREMECEYTRDRKHGACTEYYPSGGVRSEATYADGRRDGPFKGYYENNRPKEEGAYVADFSKEAADKKHGMWTFYYKTGAPRVKAEYYHGEASGPYREYFKDGTLKVMGRKSADQFVDKVTTYHETGRKQREGRFREGQLAGPVIFYARSGRKLEEVDFREDARHGVSTLYDTTGKPLLWQCFQYGERQWVSDLADAQKRPPCPDRFGLVFRPAIQEGRDFSEGYAAVKIGGKWGFLNAKGKVAISPQFDDALYFVNDLAGVSIDEGKTWFAIDKTGTRVQDTAAPAASARGSTGGIRRVVTKGRTDYFQYGRSLWASGDAQVEEGQALFRVQKEGKWGFINAEGTPLIAPRYEYAGPFSDGLAAVGHKGRLGFIDANAELVIPAIYQKARAFHCGMAAVELNGVLTYVDAYGLRVSRQPLAQAKDCTNALARVQIGEKWGYLHHSGRLVIPPRFEEAAAFSEGFAQAPSEKGFIDRTGRVVYDGFLPVTRFSEGVAIGNDVQSGRDNYFVIDATGKRTEIEEKGKGRGSLRFASFNDGLARMTTPEGFGYVGLDGKTHIAATYKGARSFSGGLAAVKSEAGWGFIDTEGKTVVEHQFTEVGDFHDGVAQAKSEGKWGYIDRKGAWVVKPTYDGAEDFERGLGRVQTGDAFGYVNGKGEVVWQPSK